MYLCYVDESGDDGKKLGSSRFLVLGAAALFEGRWAHVRRDLHTLVEKHFPSGPKPEELHATDIRHGRGLFSKLGREQRTTLLNDYCSLVTSMLESEIRLFTVAIDKHWWFAQHPDKTGHDLYLDAFENLVSRFDLFLRRLHAMERSSKGVVIADPHSTVLVAALKSALVEFQMSGTRWANLYNVIETVLFLDSHESPGLQIADLCAHSIRRLVEFGDESLARGLAPAFDREPMGSSLTPGKWHGVKYFGNDPAVQGRIRSIWPQSPPW